MKQIPLLSTGWLEHFPAPLRASDSSLTHRGGLQPPAGISKALPALPQGHTWQDPAGEAGSGGTAFRSHGTLCPQAHAAPSRAEQR